MIFSPPTALFWEGEQFCIGGFFRLRETTLSWVRTVGGKIYLHELWTWALLWSESRVRLRLWWWGTGKCPPFCICALPAHHWHQHQEHLRVSESAVRPDVPGGWVWACRVTQ